MTEFIVMLLKATEQSEILKKHGLDSETKKELADELENLILEQEEQEKMK